MYAIRSYYALISNKNPNFEIPIYSNTSLSNTAIMTASGMGLMLAQKYTQWLDGQFTMHSMQEQGTTCMVSFTKNK